MNDATPSGIFARHPEGAKNFGCNIPLYTAPPVFRPPSDKQIIEVVCKQWDWKEADFDKKTYIALARSLFALQGATVQPSEDRDAALEAMRKIREKAIADGMPLLTLDEINEEISEAGKGAGA